MRAINIAVVLVAVSMPFVSVSYAQSERPGEPPSPVQPPNQSACPPDGGGLPRSDETSRSLSEGLAASKGVICPPAGTDPGISVPPIGGGRTPELRAANQAFCPNSCGWLSWQRPAWRRRDLQPVSALVDLDLFFFGSCNREQICG